MSTLILQTFKVYFDILLISLIIHKVWIIGRTSSPSTHNGVTTTPAFQAKIQPNFAALLAVADVDITLPQTLRARNIGNDAVGTTALKITLPRRASVPTATLARLA